MAKHRRRAGRSRRWRPGFWDFLENRHGRLQYMRRTTQKRVALTREEQDNG